MSAFAYKSYVRFAALSKSSVKVCYMVVKCSIFQDPTSNLSLEYQNYFIWLLTMFALQNFQLIPVWLTTTQIFQIFPSKCAHDCSSKIDWSQKVIFPSSQNYTVKYLRKKEMFWTTCKEQPVASSCSDKPPAWTFFKSQYKTNKYLSLPTFWIYL